MSYRFVQTQSYSNTPKVHDYLKFRFWSPLRVELGPYGSFFDETNSKNDCHVCNWLVFNRNETFLYAIHQHSEKRIDIHCKD